MRDRGLRVGVLAYCLAVLSLLAVGVWFAVDGETVSAKAAPAENVGGTTFPCTGTGAIPDNNPGGLTITCEVTGLSGSPTDVSVDFAATHTWVGDLDVVLAAPEATTHDIFINVGGPGLGDTSDLGGTYTFIDSATLNFWTAAGTAGAAEPVPPGSYRSSTTGGGQTIISDTFSGVANANGTWTLKFTDGAAGDTGGVSSANLTITAAAAPSGGTITDFDGDGMADKSIIRDNSAPLSGSPAMARAGSYRDRLRMMGDTGTGKGRTSESVGPPTPGTSQDWYINNSGGSPTVSSFGNSIQDFVVPQDFDGDGQADIAIWRGLNMTGPGGGYFMIFRSGDQTVDTIDLGIQGDDPTVSGDYDGDGKADPAVFRCPTTAGQCYYYYIGSSGNPGGNITFNPWGYGTPGTVFSAVGDYDGDGRYDFNVQTTNPNQAGGGLFSLFRSGDQGVEFIPWGLNTDLIVPGDYDGDGKTDIAIGRSQGGQRIWWVLERDGGTQSAAWGASTDIVTPADFDGDGKTDLAVYRPSDGTYYIYNSGSATVSGFQWGVTGDYPLANFQVH